MGWNNPICQECKKPITSPSHAIAFYASAWWSHALYHHDCLPVANFDSTNEFSFLKNIAAPFFMSLTNFQKKLLPKRDRAQQEINKTYSILFFFASGSVSLFISSSINFFAGSIFSLFEFILMIFSFGLSIMFIHSIIKFPVYLFYLETELERINNKKRTFDINLFLDGRLTRNSVILLTSAVFPKVFMPDLDYKIVISLMFLSLVLSIIISYIISKRVK